jgi:transposase
MGNAARKLRAGPEDARASIRKWMSQHGHSETSLAETLGTSQASVNRWLNVSRPEEAFRVALETVTGTPAEWWRTPSEWDVIDRAAARTC